LQGVAKHHLKKAVHEQYTEKNWHMFWKLRRKNCGQKVLQTVSEQLNACS